MALLNRRVLVLYDVPGPDLWHERLVLQHIAGDDYVVATPDSDVHYEELSLLNADLRGIRVKPNAVALPPGIAAAQVYPLPAFAAAELQALRDESLVVLNAERGVRGVVAPAQAGQAVIAPAGFVAGALFWVAAEAAGGYKYGEAVQGVGANLVKGSKHIHTLADGTSIFVECIDGGDRVKFLQRPAMCDARVVPQEVDALGKPDCSLKEASKKFQETDVGWSLTGPRTSRWCISYLVVEGVGFEGHHERFRSLCKIEASSWGVQEHFQLSMIAKHALQVDQLNGYNNLFLEVIFRRLQTIEYAYADRAREQESKAVGGRMSLEEQQTFGGVTRQAGTLMVCPELLDYVKLEVERDASLAKNLRKAREERELARRQGGKKKQGEDAP